MGMSLVPKMTSYEDTANGIKIEGLNNATLAWQAFDKVFSNSNGMSLSPYNSNCGVRITFSTTTVIDEVNIYIGTGYGSMSSMILKNEKGESFDCRANMNSSNGAAKFNFKLDKPLSGKVFSLTTSVGQWAMNIQEIEFFGMRLGYVLLEIDRKLCTIVNGNVTVISSDLTKLNNFTNHAIPIGDVIKNMDAIKNVGENFKILSVSI